MKKVIKNVMTGFMALSIACVASITPNFINVPTAEAATTISEKLLTELVIAAKVNAKKDVNAVATTARLTGVPLPLAVDDVMSQQARVVDGQLFHPESDVKEALKVLLKDKNVQTIYQEYTNQPKSTSILQLATDVVRERILMDVQFTDDLNIPDAIGKDSWEALKVFVGIMEVKDAQMTSSYKLRSFRTTAERANMLVTLDNDFRYQWYQNPKMTFDAASRLSVLHPNTIALGSLDMAVSKVAISMKNAQKMSSNQTEILKVQFDAAKDQLKKGVTGIVENGTRYFFIKMNQAKSARKLSFVVNNCKPTSSQTCYIIGDFNGWSTVGAVKLGTNGAPASTPLSGSMYFLLGKKIQYKVVKVDNNSGQIISWESGTNRVDTADKDKTITITWK